MKACGLRINPARLPLASLRPFIGSPAYLLFDFAGDPVPPKEPPSLRWEAPPPKHLSTFVSEPDPINLPFCLFSRVELEQCSCQQLLVENCRAPFADLAV